MPESVDHEELKSSEAAGSRMLPRIAASLAGVIAFAVAWFWIAGRANWVQGWVFLVSFVVFSSVLALRLARSDPDLVTERSHRAENVEPWDRVVITCYTVLMFALLILSALDSGRCSWSAVPSWVQILSWVPLCVGAGMIWHVMSVNAYLSSWARIQDDRGHVVVRRGLYRHVRHPMYLGIIIVFACVPLVLGSWWSLIPGLAIIGLFVYRTAREDRMLLDGLPGYHEYAAVVRYRLLPRVW